MPNYDDLLQKKISEIESGLPIDAVLQDLPEDSKELATLIKLASVVRTMPHPEPIFGQVQAQRQAVLLEAKTQPRPVIRPAVSTWDTIRAIFSPAATLSMTGAFALLIVMVVIGANFWTSSRNMDTARVQNIVGQVQVASDADGSDWKNLSNGERLLPGQRIRALGASSATLVFYEGTHSYLTANSDVTLAQLNGSAGQKIQVEVAQNKGETHHKVTPLKGDDSFFLVRTSTGVASVHGTSFKVKVNENGASQFAVNTGEVRVSNDFGEVTLLAGQATLANASGTIEDPEYLFNVIGSLTAKEEGSWTVSGMTFAISEDTSITGVPELGDTVIVTGRILEDGTLVADSIEPAGDSDQNASFTGELESIGDAWVISGTSVQVTSETALDADLAIGDPVRVTFNLLDDGTWLALVIEKLAEEQEQPTPTPTATPDPSAMPSYEFTPDELGASDCDSGSSAFHVTGTLRNTSTDAKDYAANVALGYLIDRGGEYVNSVELVPSGWTRLDANQTVTFNVNVTMNADWANAPEDTEVKLRVFVASATNRPDHLNGRLTVTISTGCELTPTPGASTDTPTGGAGTSTPENTGSLTATAEITGIVTATPTALPTETGACTGADPHPTGMKLAQRYGMPYEEIMYWFCQHYGFGEIDLAYSLAAQYGKPVEEIFAMRASGLGWGNIKKELASQDESDDQGKEKGQHSSGDDDDDGEKQDKRNDNGKDKKKKP